VTGEASAKLSREGIAEGLVDEAAMGLVFTAAGCVLGVVCSAALMVALWLLLLLFRAKTRAGIRGRDVLYAALAGTLVSLGSALVVAPLLFLRWHVGPQFQMMLAVQILVPFAAAYVTAVLTLASRSARVARSRPGDYASSLTLQTDL
jgi:hypothetical protein